MSARLNSSGETALQYLARNSAASPETGCHMWHGAVSNGYGRARFSGVVYGAHRLAWESKKGSIPNGLFVLHRCDTPLCINPEHLFLGTQGDNMRDRSEKGRAPLHRAKLSLKDAADIRARLHFGDKIADLAKKYGVNRASISRIKLGRSWKIETLKAYGFDIGHMPDGYIRELKHGSYQPDAKLNAEQALEIFRSELSITKLAEKFGVSRTAIRAVKLGRTWRKVTRRAAQDFEAAGDDRSAADCRGMAMGPR